MMTGLVEVESGTSDRVVLLLARSVVEEPGEDEEGEEEEAMSLVRVLPMELYQSAKNSTLLAVPRVESQ